MEKQKLLLAHLHIFELQENRSFGHFSFPLFKSAWIFHFYSLQNNTVGKLGSR